MEFVCDMFHGSIAISNKSLLIDFVLVIIPFDVN